MKAKILIALTFLFSLTVHAQYNPARHAVSNKALGISGNAPTDARSMFYDTTTFTYRPFNSTAEALSYLNTSAKRFGNYPIYIKNGSVVDEYSFKDGTANSNLVLKASGVGTITTDSTLRNIGGVIGINTTKFNEYPVVKRATDLRLLTPKTATVYRVVDSHGMIGDFYYDSTDVSTPDDSVMTVVAGTARLKRAYDEIDPAWFGAYPDDGIDDSQAIQRAINYAISHTVKPVVKFTLSGTYLEHDLVIGNFDGDGQASFVTISIIGTNPPVDAGIPGVGGVHFYNTNNQSAGIHLQTARNVLIRDIIFRGIVPQPSTAYTIYDKTDAQWTNSGAVRNNRYSPHCAIDIDGLTSAIGGSNRYPGMLSYYANNTYGGTSNVLIENCPIYDYIVGIAESPGGYVANGDNITYNGGYAYNVQYFWAAGQTQSRQNLINNLYVVGHVQTLIDGVSFGTGIGTLPAVHNSSLNNIKYLFQANGEFTDVNFSNDYGEELWCFGKSNSDFPISFTDCKFTLRNPSASPTIYAAPLLFEGTCNFNFTGGKIEWSDNLWQAPLTFKCRAVNFRGGTLLRSGVPVNVGANFGNVWFDNVTWATSASQGNLLSEDMDLRGINENSVPSLFLPGSKAETDTKVNLTNVGPKFEQIFLGSATITVNTTTKTASFTVPNAGFIYAGDVLYTTDDISGGTTVFSTSPKTLGFVSSVVGSTATLSYISDGLASGTNYQLYAVRIPRYIPKKIGDVTNGSATITNVLGGTYPAGAYINGFGIYPGTRVISSTSTTITLSYPAYENHTGVALYDAKIKGEGNNEFFNYFGGGYNAFLVGRVYQPGDIIRNTTNTPANTAMWYCTKGGLMTSTTAPPIFAELKDASAGGVSSEAFLDSIAAVRALMNQTDTIAGENLGTGGQVYVAQDGPTLQYRTIKINGSAGTQTGTELNYTVATGSKQSYVNGVLNTDTTASTFNINLPIVWRQSTSVITTANFTAMVYDQTQQIYRYEGPGGTVTMPFVNSLNRGLTFQIKNTSANTLTFSLAANRSTTATVSTLTTGQHAQFTVDDINGVIWIDFIKE